MSAIGTELPLRDVSASVSIARQSGPQRQWIRKRRTGQFRSGAVEVARVSLGANDAPMCIGTIKGITNKSLRLSRGHIGMCPTRSSAAAWWAGWTQRGPSAAGFQSEFVSKIKGWTH
jgi:hypothetical protein